MFRALIMLYSSAPDFATPDASRLQYPSHTLALVILARPLRSSADSARYLPTEIWRDAGTPLRLGDHALVTVRVMDDLADDFLDVGQQFTLWSRGQVGRGTVCSRLYAECGPS